MTPAGATRDAQPIALHDWLAMHGPLWPAIAVGVALDACARASVMGTTELGAVVGSLNSAGIARHRRDGWCWSPVREGPGARAVSDSDVIERVGAILFHALTAQRLGDAFASDQAVRGRMRSLRPDIPADIADATVDAISVRRRSGVTLTAFASDLRRAMGVERASHSSRSRRTIGSVAGVAAILIATAVSWAGWRSATRLESRTRSEIALLDVSVEAANTFALIDEHTVAIQQYQQVARLWRSRLAPEDPRIGWNQAHEAWVRGLAGDRFTAEQLLVDAPEWLARQLGERHPYTRTARLLLAAVLDARGATSEGATLRATADRGTRELLQDDRRAADVAPGIPTPPGVIAHVAPNAAEREGFRRGSDGAFFAPLTSLQRLAAGRDGWRLHIVAANNCRATVVVGTVARRIVVSATRIADRTWQVHIDGTAPPVSLATDASDQMSVSLLGDPDGSVQAHVVGRSHVSVVDTSAQTPPPPYALAFDDANAGGCAVVWFEIPFPSSAAGDSASIP